MRCNNCGAELHIGAPVCTVCGTSVTLEQQRIDHTNPASVDFLPQSNIQKEPSLGEITPQTRVHVIKTKKNYKLTKPLEGNNRIVATAINFATFAAILAVIIIIIVVLYNALF